MADTREIASALAHRGYLSTYTAKATRAERVVRALWTLRSRTERDPARGRSFSGSLCRLSASARIPDTDTVERCNGIVHKRS